MKKTLVQYTPKGGISQVFTILKDVFKIRNLNGNYWTLKATFAALKTSVFRETMVFWGERSEACCNAVWDFRNAQFIYIFCFSGLRVKRECGYIGVLFLYIFCRLRNIFLSLTLHNSETFEPSPMAPTAKIWQSIKLHFQKYFVSVTFLRTSFKTPQPN